MCGWCVFVCFVCFVLLLPIVLVLFFSVFLPLCSHFFLRLCLCVCLWWCMWVRGSASPHSPLVSVLISSQLDTLQLRTLSLHNHIHSLTRSLYHTHTHTRTHTHTHSLSLSLPPPPLLFSLELSQSSVDVLQNGVTDFGSAFPMVWCEAAFSSVFYPTPAEAPVDLSCKVSQCVSDIVERLCQSFRCVFAFSHNPQPLSQPFICMCLDLLYISSTSPTLSTPLSNSATLPLVSLIPHILWVALMP
jgi:hypothetical protein